MNESISTSAGASYGQLVPPSELRRWIRDLGRAPVQRDTLYRTVQTYETEPEQPEPLDLAKANAAELFGSYDELIKLDDWRFTGQRAPSLEGRTWLEIKRG
jgi:FO synthase subunit 2